MSARGSCRRSGPCMRGPMGVGGVCTWGPVGKVASVRGVQWGGSVGVLSTVSQALAYVTHPVSSLPFRGLGPGRGSVLM